MLVTWEALKLYVAPPSLLTSTSTVCDVGCSTMMLSPLLSATMVRTPLALSVTDAEGVQRSSRVSKRNLTFMKTLRQKGRIKRVFSIITWKLTVTPAGKCRKFWAGNAWPRRALPCLVQGSIFRIPPKASHAPKIYLNPRSFNVAATFGCVPVRTVENPVSATGPPRAFYTTSATWFPVGRTTSTLSTRNINAPSARSSSTPTPPNTLCPKPTTPIASSRWLCGSWSRMACRINRPVGTCGATTGFSSLTQPSKTGWRLGGKKAASQMDVAYLDWALADFSGYVAIDELYDGPFCVSAIVDNRTFKRLIYQVLDHDPNHKDITAFLRRFQTHLQQRGLTLRGVTTDASPLYPEPLRTVFGDIPHQLCEFHIIKELTKAILRAVAKVRKSLETRKPTLKRGRPSGTAAKKAARQRKRLQQKIADLFEHRYLFVQHTLTAAECRTLQHITRGLPQLRTLREIMEEEYRLFDRLFATNNP